MEIDFKFNNKNVILYLGEQNFETAESAILEIVKNAYDAGATILSINISKNMIEFIDNGNGMNLEDIKTKWMNVGTSEKGYVGVNNRVMTGNKGIGRFALARLGKEVSLKSKKEDFDEVIWETDWEKNSVKENKNDINSIESEGTIIICNSLNDTWNNEKIKKLYNFLNKVIKGKELKVSIYDKILEEKYEVNNIFNYVEDIGYLNFKFNFEDKLNISVYNSIFSEEIAEKFNFNLSDTFKKEISSKFDELNGISGNFYYSFKRVEKHVIRFKYKNIEKNTIPGLLETNGIIMYRNDFSVNGYDGTIDWSGLQQRAQASPAAATHPKGNFRFRKNNIVGYIDIDKEKHKTLEDLSNRQGLIKNDSFDKLKELLNIVFSEVEDYYQNIIRTIAKNNKEKSEENVNKVEDIIAKYNTVMIDSEEYEKLNNFQKETKLITEHVNNLSDEIKDLQYDLAMMEILATQAILIISSKHDLKKEYGDIPGSMETIRRKLSKYEGNDVEVARRIIDETESNYKSFSNRMDNFLNNIKKERLYFKEINLYKYFEEVKVFWGRESHRVKIEINCPSNLNIYTDYNTLDVMFYNLMSNSVKHNIDDSELLIHIDVENIEDRIVFQYSDNGIGLEEKYRNGNENKIFKIQNRTENSGIEGYGLGMWIFDRRLQHIEGKILELSGDQGFKIKFYLKERNEGKYIIHR